MVRKHALEFNLDHFGNLPAGSHITPGGLMVANWLLDNAEPAKGAKNPTQQDGVVRGQVTGMSSAAPVPPPHIPTRSLFAFTPAVPAEPEKRTYTPPSFPTSYLFDPSQHYALESSGPIFQPPLLASGSSRPLSTVSEHSKATAPPLQATPWQDLLYGTSNIGLSNGTNPTALRPFSDSSSSNVSLPTRGRGDREMPSPPISVTSPIEPQSSPSNHYNGKGKAVMTDCVTPGTIAATLPSLIPSRRAEHYGLYYLAAFKVIICLDCQSGLDPQHVFVHLKREHHLPQKAKEDLEQLVNELSPLPVNQVMRPHPYGPAFDNLAIFDALNCLRCTYTAKNKSSLREHVRQGRCFTELEKGDRTFVKARPCKAQAFFQSLGRKVFPIRISPDQRVAVQFPGLTPDMITKEKESFSSFIQTLEYKKPLGQVRQQELSPWLKRTGWATMFANVELQTIRCLMQSPGGTFNGYLEILGKSCERVFKECRSLYNAKQTIHTRRWMSSTKATEFPPSPWSHVYDDTEIRYFGLMRRIVVYIAHLIMGRYILQTPYKDLLILTREQSAALTPILVLLAPGTTSEMIQDQELDGLVFRFCMTLIEYKFAETNTSQAALLHAVAVMGIGEGGVFRPPNYVSSDIAGLVYCCKLLLFKRAFELSSKCADQSSIEATICEQYRILHYHYVASTCLSPLSQLISLKGWGMTIGHGESSVPDIIWSQAFGVDSVTFHGIKILTDKFKVLVQCQIEKAESILLETFGLHSPHFTPESLLSIRDDTASRSPGYCFSTESGNQACFPQEAILETVLSHEPLYKRLVRIVEGRLVYMESGKAVIRSRSQELLRTLLFLFHVVSGQPARATEIMKITWRNSALSNRNIFIASGGILWITDYFKGRNQLGWSKFIPRFLPPRIAAIYVTYITRILPLYMYFKEPSEDQLTIAPRYYLFSDDGINPWSGDVLSNVLRDASCGPFGEHNALNISSYRHMVISMSRRYLGEGFPDEPESEEDSEDPFDLQAAHSSHTADLIYGVRADIVYGVSERSLKVFQAVSSAWQRFLSSNITAAEWLKRKEDALKNSLKNCPCGGVGNLASTVASAPVPQPQGFYSNGFPCSVKRSSVEEAEKQARNILTSIYGPDSLFKSKEQALGIRLIIEGTTPLLVILPTGGGKSLLFEGPASVPSARHNVTIVIVPLIALRADLHRRALAHGLDSQEWNGHCNQDTCLLFITAESAVKPVFKHYVRSLIVRRRLDRIVIDEAHTLIHGSDFREAYKGIFWYSSLGVQIVFLTATLPPYLHGEFDAAALITNTVIVRANSIRRNTKYVCIKTTRSFVNHQAVSIVKERISKLDPSERILVYARSVSTCETLAQLLDCGSYHSEKPGKDDALKDWLDGRSTVLIATSALGAGVDVNKIRLVLFVNMPHSYVDFYQGSGRGGRDGKPCSTTVLYAADELNAMNSPHFDADAESLKAFLATEGCRRLYISEYFDGKRQPCEPESGDILCDNCARRANPGATGEAQEAASIDSPGNILVPMTPLAPNPRHPLQPPRSIGGIDSTSRRLFQSSQRVSAARPDHRTLVDLISPVQLSPYRVSKPRTPLRAISNTARAPIASISRSPIFNTPQRLSLAQAQTQFRNKYGSPRPQPFHHARPSTWPTAQSKQRQADIWARINSELEPMTQQCSFCWVTTRSSIALDHCIKTCTQRVPLEHFPPYEPTHSSYRSWRKRLELQNYTCCFDCVLPQSLCNPSKREKCLYGRDIIAPIAFLAHFLPSLRSQVELLIGQGPLESTSYLDWLIRPIEFHGRKACNVMKVFELALNLPPQNS